MSPITETKKKAAPQQASQLSSLQKHGMSEDSLKGRDEISSLVGERGKPAAGPIQQFVRGIAKNFFNRAGKGESKDSKKK